jgi:hypothetical protein
MPPGYVKMIREELLYKYAKLISRSAHGKIVYLFVSDRFKKLRDGQVTISGTIREWEREHELPHECVFCGTTENLSTDHLIGAVAATILRIIWSRRARHAIRQEATRACSSGWGSRRRTSFIGSWRGSI